ncbi:type II toxin-antitoxin system HicB family antitoxin [Enterococcus sp. DIV0240a]|uniref:type II toxin-antitoxin system HicB family antitoxin n=1 Tax=Enterococcus sp. DIV0240a TaxID=2774651 RepID=UPI003D2A3253
MLLTYPAVFYSMTDDDKPYYFIHFPDVDGNGTQAEDINEGMEMASDYLGLNLSYYIEEESSLPVSSAVKNINIKDAFPLDESHTYNLEDTFITLVSVDINEYLDMDKRERKNVSIPKWAVKLGKELKINFSETLTNAIVKKAEELKK